MFKKLKRLVSRVFIHCSASDNPEHDDINVIRKWHTAPKPVGNGWSSIGYHYFIQGDGTRKLGRALELIPAAQKPHNTGTIAICLHGLGVHNFTEAQRKALKELCTEINIEYEGKISFHGHKEVNPGKECPVFDYKEWLDLDKFGRMPLKPKEYKPCRKYFLYLLSHLSSLFPFLR